jgi:hypothetical protein
MVLSPPFRLVRWIANDPCALFVADGLIVDHDGNPLRRTLVRLNVLTFVNAAIEQLLKKPFTFVSHCYPPFEFVP